MTESITSEKCTAETSKGNHASSAEMISELVTRLLIGDISDSENLHFSAPHPENSWLDGVALSISTAQIVMENETLEITATGLYCESVTSISRYQLFCRLINYLELEEGVILAFRKALSRGDLTIEFKELMDRGMDTLFKIELSDRNREPPLEKFGIGKGYLFKEPALETAVH